MENKEQRLNEAIMDNALFSCSGMRRGKHHLYDEMADSVKVTTKRTTNNTEEA